MKSVEESGLSFGISRLLACAEQNVNLQNGLAAAAAAMVNPAHLQFTNASAHHSPLSHNVSLLQQTHSSFNQSMDIENSSNHSKSSINGETKLPNSESTLNLMNSFVHYNNLASIAANHSANGSFLNKTPIDGQLKGQWSFKKSFSCQEDGKCSMNLLKFCQIFRRQRSERIDEQHIAGAKRGGSGRLQQFALHSAETNRSSVPEPDTTKTQEAAHLLQPNANPRARKALSTAKVPGIHRTCWSRQRSRNERRTGEDLVPESTHQVSVS